MKDKQLINISREDVMWKARNGLALSLKELSIASGYGYSKWREWKARGLPLISGKITLKKAMSWIDQLQSSREEKSEAQHLSHLQDAAASKFGVQV